MATNDDFPEIPKYCWPLERRLDWSQDQCEEPGRHPGRARRHKREVTTREQLYWRKGVLAGTVTFTDSTGARHTWRELIYTPVEDRTPAFKAIRSRAQVLMDRVTMHGPGSGWGMAQPVRDDAKWTPYYVPKPGEKCWRAWRALGHDLRQVLQLLASWWLRLVPAHRSLLLGRTTGNNSEKAPALGEERNRTGYRDQSWQAGLAALRQAKLDLGM